MSSTKTLFQQKNKFFIESDDKDLEECTDDLIKEDNYDPNDLEETPLELSLEYKEKVVVLAQLHPKWSLRTLQKNGARHLKRKYQLQQWKEDIQKGGPRIDKLRADSETFDNFTEVKRCLEQIISDVSAEASNQTDKTKGKSQIFNCDICNVLANSSKTLDVHLKGRRHLNKVKKAKREEQLSNKIKPTLENKEESSLVVFDPKQNSNTTEVDMNASKKSSRKHNRHLYRNNGYYPDHYHQPYPNINFRQNQGKHRNWHYQPALRPHWQDPPWDLRNGGYTPYDRRDFGFRPRYFSPDGSPTNQHQMYQNWDQHSGYDGTVCGPDGNVLSEDSLTKVGVSVEDQQLESHSSADPNLGNHSPKSQVRHSPSVFGRNQNSLAKKPTSKKHNSPVVGSGQESNKCSKTGTSSDDEKQVERRSILTENMVDKISHWVNPSNPKDKAEVMRLVTEFSKSKKKENLLKLKLQTDSTSNENNCDSKEETSGHTSLSSDVLEVSDTHSTVVKPNNLWNNNAVSRRKKRSKSETLQQAGNINPFISTESSGGSSTSQPGKGLHRFRSATESPSKKVRRKSLSNSVEESHMSENAQVLKEVAAEKKRKEQKCGNSKKHKCSTAECLESCINEVVKREIVPSTALTNVKETDTSVSPIPPVSSMDVSTVVPSNPVISKVEVPNSAEQVQKVPVKQEIMDFEGLNRQLHPCILEAFTLEDHMNKQMSGNPNQSDGATMTPVESLIDLFASGNVKVKKEFDDPIIDVIRTVDPEILNRVCEGQSLPTTQETPIENHVQDSVVDSESLSVKETPAMSDATDTGDVTNNLPFLKSSFKNILNEIQCISTLEEKVMENQEQADSKIQEYQALVDEWKTKKIKFQSEEETLRKQRNNLVRTMADLVTQCNVEQSTATDTGKQNDSTSSSLVPTADAYVSCQNNAFHSEKLAPSNNSSAQHQQNRKPAVRCSTNNRKSKVQETEDIAILPVPVKSSNIPVIDLEESNSSEETSTPIVIENGLSSDTDALIERFSKERNYAAHTVTVNCIQFFEDYLYTSSNDCTAKRFSLKSCIASVTYHHQKRNVTQLCVEKVRGLTLVFTICSGSKIVSSFKAEDGILLRTFSLNYTVASICKGRGLIYAGLRNGSIIVCNWKDHREIVNISEPIRSIDTTYQGRLNILVTLSINGNVSIRDADRNGLLIRYVKARSYVPLFMTVCSDSIYLSSAGVLTVLDIESGTFITKYSFSAAYTSLAVYRDSIFTASFSGMVRCYSKDEEKAVKMYYGAGSTAITCIHVYHGWVFTGNRFGTLSVFKYDPNTVHSCKIGKCDFLFPRLEDLEWHVLMGRDHDLPVAGAVCTWHKCQFIIPHNWDTEAIKAHVKSHL